MVQALRIGEDSVFIGQTCALCKQAFGVGDEVVICPEDGARHHRYCWQANGNKCTAYGCTGSGAAATVADGAAAARRRTTGSRAPRPRATPPDPQPQPSQQPQPPQQQPRATRARRQRRTTTAPPPPPPPPTQPYGSKVRTMPSGGLGCRHSCLILGIIFAAILIAIGCFGLLSIAEYVMDWYQGQDFRLPFDDAAAIPALLPWLSAAFT